MFDVGGCSACFPVSKRARFVEKRFLITALPGHFSNAEKTEWMLSSSFVLQFCRLEDNDSP